MGKSKKSIKLFVEFDGLKLVYIAKKSDVIGKVMKKLEKKFQECFHLDEAPAFEKVFENGYLVSPFDIVEDVFTERTELLLESPKPVHKPLSCHSVSSEKSQRPLKKDHPKEKDPKPHPKFPDQSPADKLKPTEKDQKPFHVPAKKQEEPKKEDQKREDLKKEEKKSEPFKKDDLPKDSKQDSTHKKPKRPEIKEPIVKYSKSEEDRKPISNDLSKKDPLMTSSSSESDSDIFTKDERKPMLSKSNIFRP